MQMIMKDVEIMTFDEPIEKLEQLANFEVGKTTGNNRRDFKLELGDVRDLLTELREEYAPTVEMTKEQADKIDSFKKNLSASELPRVIHNYPEGDWSFLDELSGKLFGHQQGGMTDQNIEDIMRIWLHPETIKVVDE